jgi:hypothetical protein
VTDSVVRGSSAQSLDGADDVTRRFNEIDLAGHSAARSFALLAPRIARRCRVSPTQEASLSGQRQLYQATP